MCQTTWDSLQFVVPWRCNDTQVRIWVPIRIRSVANPHDTVSYIHILLVIHSFHPQLLLPIVSLVALNPRTGSKHDYPVIIPSKSTSSIMLFTSVVCYLMLYPTISNDIPTTIPIKSHQITLLETHTRYP